MSLGRHGCGPPQVRLEKGDDDGDGKGVGIDRFSILNIFVSSSYLLQAEQYRVSMIYHVYIQ